MLKQFLETALAAELSDHLGYEYYEYNGKSPNGNRRSSVTKKIVKSSNRSFKLDTPRDRDGNFDPHIVRKRQTILNEDIDAKIISF